MNVAGYGGYYWSSTVQSGTSARILYLGSGGSDTQYSSNRRYGFSLRCLALYPTTGDKGFTARPLFFVRGGYSVSQSLRNNGYRGFYSSSTNSSKMDIIYLLFQNGYIVNDNNNKMRGYSLRYVVSGRICQYAYSCCQQDIRLHC